MPLTLSHLFYILLGSALFLFFLTPYFAKLRVQKFKGVHTYSPHSRTDFKWTTGTEFEDVQKLRDIPGYLVILLLLHEDDHFLLHNGFNWPEVRRNLALLRKGEKFHGGSSISQQLVKNFFPHYWRGNRWKRKWFEIWNSLAIERYFTKVEILLLYLHNVRFSYNDIFGITEAAKYYFNKTPATLDIEEGLFLFGIIPHPSHFEWQIVDSGSKSQFRFLNSHSKIIDLTRIVLKSFGPLVLNSIETITFDQAIEVMSHYDTFSHHDFTAAEQAAFEIRAALIISRINRLIIRMHETRIRNDNGVSASS